jgi:hypothetical protein
MRLAWLLAPLAFVPRLAHANQCDAGQSLLSNHEIPQACSIRAYVPAGTPVSNVKLTVERSGATVDVTGTVTALGSMDLPIHYFDPDYDAQCADKITVQPLAYDAYDLTFTANVGETMHIAGSFYRSSTVVAGGPCPAPEEYLDGSNWIQCSATVQEFQECNDDLCTPLASQEASCHGGSNDGSDDPGNFPHGSDDSGCAAANASLGIGAPLALLALAFARVRSRSRRAR